MRYRSLILLLFVFAAAGLSISSCKKENTNNLQTLLTTGQWQLASFQVTHYIGAAQLGLVDTIGVNCNEAQFFKFNTDLTCSYTNFDCQPNATATGHWVFESNQVFLNSDIVCKETVATRDSTAAASDTTNLTSPTGFVTVKPFAVARIVNLGQYSLVLQTGDLETYFPPTQKRTVVQYGFIRVKTQ